MAETRWTPDEQVSNNGVVETRRRVVREPEKYIVTGERGITEVTATYETEVTTKRRTTTSLKYERSSSWDQFLKWLRAWVVKLVPPIIRSVISMLLKK